MHNLNERRAHPNQNSKLTPLEQLKDLYESHRDGGTLYVSFTMAFGKNDQRSPLGPKLGINPQSDFQETPIAVYCYPANVVIEYTEVEGLDTVLGSNNGGLQAPFTGKNAWHKAWVFKIDETHELTPQLSLSEYNEALDELRDILNLSDDAYAQLLYDAGAHRGHYCVRLWEITKRASKLQSAGNYTAKWNNLLRQLGYTAVVDPGLGFIHDNEETQTAILDPRIIKPIDVIDRYDGVDMLFVKMRERLAKNPMLLAHIPENVVSRIPMTVAREMVTDFVDNGGNLDVAQNFVMKSDHARQLIETLCNDPTHYMRLVGLQFLNRSNFHVKLFPAGLSTLILDTNLALDNEMATNAISFFKTTSDEIKRLLDHPERVHDFAHFKYLVDKMRPVTEAETYVGQNDFVSRIKKSDRFKERCVRAIMRLKKQLHDMPAGKQRMEVATRILNNYPSDDDHAYADISYRIASPDWDVTDYDEDEAVKAANVILDDAIEHPADWDCIAGEAFTNLYGAKK